jgi:transcriptional regulator with XRE-family HTH domain
MACRFEKPESVEPQSAAAATIRVMPKPLASSELMTQAGLRLRAARQVLDVSQEVLAAQIKVERAALANWEQGSRLVSVLAMMRLYQRFGIPLEWIYCGELRQVPYEIGEQLKDEAAKIGAVVGGPVAEWPMAVVRRPGLAAQKPAAAVPRKRPKPGGWLHEPPSSSQ